MIAVLLPVLGRPARAEPLLASLEAAAGDVPYLPVFLCSQGDPEQETACRALDGRAETLVVPWEAGAGDYARKINLGVRETGEPYVFTGADDLDFQPGWAEAALERIEAVGVGVCGTNDQANPSVKKGVHATHSLVARDYIEECGGTFDQEPGVLMFEGYDHQYCDTELVRVAQDRECWTFAPDSLVTHLHPFYTAAKLDATYRKGLARGRHDKRIFEQRLRVWQRSS